MQMRLARVRIARSTDRAEPATARDDLSRANGQRAELLVRRDDRTAANADRQASTGHATREVHPPGARAANNRPGRRAEVDAAVLAARVAIAHDHERPHDRPVHRAPPRTGVRRRSDDQQQQQ